MKTRDFGAYLRDMIAKDPKLAFMVEQARIRGDIAQLLYDNRTESKLTYKKIGKAIGLSAVHIESIEESDYEPITLDLLQRLAGVFNKKLVISFEDK